MEIQFGLGFIYVFILEIVLNVMLGQSYKLIDQLCSLGWIFDVIKIELVDDGFGIILVILDNYDLVFDIDVVMVFVFVFFFLG